MTFPRASGILLHPTSLPGRFGIGDLGPAAYRFANFLLASGQSLWQVLPLGPTGYGDSPYQCFSAFAGNTLLISPEKLLDDGLITDDDLTDKPDSVSGKVDFNAVGKFKAELLAKAYRAFDQTTNADLQNEFEVFCHEQKGWLDDYALYRALKISQSQKPWYEWPDRLKLRDKRTIEIAGEQLSSEIRAEKFSQFLFLRQWFA